jgi:hypothetical protein
MIVEKKISNQKICSKITVPKGKCSKLPEKSSPSTMKKTC